MKVCPQCESGYHDSHTTCPTHGGVLSEIRDLKPGMVIHQSYKIVRKLGQGGMGAVYLAHHTLMDEPQALKFLSSELSKDQAFTSRFLREVRTLKQVRHKNVVDASSLEPAEDGTLFFPMEFVDGPDLREYLRDAAKPFDVRLALEITRGIAEGLGAAHAKGMVHRDIKPENILMAREGDRWIPKIADFGIVATKESSTAYTRTGGTLLTMAYAAPEQWRGMRAAELDGRTDLYALGGVLFEMLTGRTVFEAESYEGWAEQHKHADSRPPSALRADLAEWKGLDGLALSMLAKDPEKRPRDVAELLSLLDGITYVAPVVRQVTEPIVRQKTVWENADATEVDAGTTEDNASATEVDAGATEGKEEEAEAKVRRHVPGWVWAASIVVLLIAGLAIWLIIVPKAEFYMEERKGLEALESAVGEMGESDFSREAARHFARATAIDSTDPQALLYLGVAQAEKISPGGTNTPEKLKAAKDAIATFEQVLVLRPNDGRALNAIAELYYTIDEFDAVKETLLRILSVEPRDLDADYNIGVIDWMVAYKAIRDRLSQENKSYGGEGDYANASPAACRALAESNTPVLEEAIQHLNRDLATDPNDADAISYLSLVYRLRAGTHCGDSSARAADLTAAKTYKEMATMYLAARQSGSSQPRVDSPQPASTLSLPEDIHFRLYRIPTPPPPPPPPPSARQ
jgi:serine/threonine protein kinase